MTKNVSTRNNWIELLRFIAISLILSAHFIGNNQALQGIWPDISCGVAIFLFISGFFNVKSTGWRTKKFAIQVLIWTVLGLILYGSLFAAGFPVENPLNIFFGKFISGQYNSWWFLYTYLCFTLIQPFINKFICKFNKWIVLGIIITFALASMALSNFDPGHNWIYAIITFDRLFFFIVTYSFGAWFGLYARPGIENNKKPWKTLCLLCLFIATFLLLWYRDQIWSYLNANNILTFFIYDIFNLLSAISFTLLFVSLPLIKCGVINKFFGWLGKISLSLYLMHAVSWMVLDRYYWASPEVYNLGFYALKFLIYYLTAIVFAVILFYIHKYIEKGVYYFSYKIKSKKQLKKKSK